MKPAPTAILLALVAACSGEVAGGSVDGAHVFGAVCSPCHGPDGRPPPDMIARFGVRDLTAPTFRARVTPELVVDQVRAGSKNKLMPSFVGTLSDAQIRAVADYVAGPAFVRPAPR